jgi:hypothetical protein
MGRLTGLALVAALAAVGCLGMSDTRIDNGNDNPNQPPRFAEDRDNGAQPVAFDPKRAMRYLTDICDLGPRISGTDGMKKQQELLKKHFEGLGAKVELQTFTAKQNSRPRQPVEMANLIASWQPDQKRRVILCSHYDTRPIADQERDRRDWFRPFVSANDGGSGVALLMELGHYLKDLKTHVGVDFVFFDGEEYIFNPADPARGGDKYFFGSEHFAAVYRKNKGKPTTYAAAILLDMVGGKGARFPYEGHSWENAVGGSRDLCKAIWRIAGELKCKAFVNELGTAVLDDHLALNAVGIPAIDIIDFSYVHWHRLSDVPENCSGESLEQVAKVLSVWLQRVK